MNNDIIVINQEINSYIINFILSTVMCILFGYMSFTYRKRYQFCFLIGIIIITGNFIYETVVPLLNTIDIVDSVFSSYNIYLLIFLCHFNFFIHFKKLRQISVPEDYADRGMRGTHFLRYMSPAACPNLWLP